MTSRNQYIDTSVPVRYPYFASNTQPQGPKYGDASTSDNDAVAVVDDDDVIQDKTCFSMVETQATEISTAHGYPIIFKSKHWYGKLFWILIFLTATGAFLRQAVILINKYNASPVSVEVS